MRFETVIRNGTVVTATGTCVGTRAMVLSSGLLFSVLAFPNLPASAQKPSDASEPPEILVTEQGFLTINTPKGWVARGWPWLGVFRSSGRAQWKTQRLDLYQFRSGWAERRGERFERVH